jgi:hypothetical protein
MLAASSSGHKRWLCFCTTNSCGWGTPQSDTGYPGWPVLNVRPDDSSYVAQNGGGDPGCVCGRSGGRPCRAAVPGEAVSVPRRLRRRFIALDPGDFLPRRRTDATYGYPPRKCAASASTYRNCWGPAVRLPPPDGDHNWPMPCAVRDLATVTPDELAALSIAPPQILAEGCIPLFQARPNAKYHWADKRSTCTYLPGFRWDRARADEPVVSHRVPVLGFDLPAHEICAHCAQQIAVSSNADAFISVAAEIIRATEWTKQGQQAALDGWTWQQFARWRASTDAGRPLDGHSQLDERPSVGPSRRSAAGKYRPTFAMTRAPRPCSSARCR